MTLLSLERLEEAIKILKPYVDPTKGFVTTQSNRIYFPLTKVRKSIPKTDSERLLALGLQYDSHNDAWSAPA